MAKPKSTGAKQKKAGTSKATKATKPQKSFNTDFVDTIDSESEAEVPDFEESSDEEEKPELKDEDTDLNPDFQFGIDDDVSTKFTGWDFEMDKDDLKKNVDLDMILKQKGGLTNLVGVNEEEQEEEEEEEEEEQEEETKEAENASDDEELAMDGFGMGAEESDEEEQNEEDKSSEEEEEEEGVEEEIEEIDNEEEEEEKDSEEAMNAFYENGTNSESTQVHDKFQSLQLSRPVLKALSQLGYIRPSPIQSASIPIALMGKDIVAGAVTGSGKTAAYMIPIIERLLYKPSKVASTRVIVLTPTRELAIQVCDVGKKIAHFIPSISFGLAVGGLNLRQQEQQLKSRPDVVIATPGRLIDHIRNSPSFSIDSLEIMVIDEADRMLEEGFQVELTEILSLIPKHKRQTLLFSATMNTKIHDLIQLSLQKPVRIMIDPPKAASNKLVQEFVRIRKRDHLKFALIYQLLRDLSKLSMSRIVVFVARKESAHNLRIILGLLGLKVSELHGSLSQEQRLESVTNFKNLTVPILICTDLAARGLDIPKIEVVINFDMPKSYDIYLHRVGRTARAGREGRSISFVGESSQDRAIVKDAIKSLQESKNKDSKAVSRSVDWKEVEELHKIIDSKQDIIEEVKEEEKLARELIQAEMELNKASNIMKHKQEIESRPKRTWFQSESDKKSNAMHQLTKHGKKVNSKKRKAIESKKETARPYKKTKTDRENNKRPKIKGKKGKK